MAEFIFATGIENSYPTTVVNGTVRRRDQMRETGHYDRWEEDFDRVQQLGIRYLRYGPPYYLVQEEAGKCHFSLSPEKLGAQQGFDMQERLDALEARGITPILDLCHFGVPDWAGGFNRPDWPEKFADYARQFAQTFPHVLLYTPINEIYVTANFSGQLDFWNERANSETGFVTALKTLCRANVLAMEAILDVNPRAVFIQSESSEYFHPKEAKDVPAAEFLNLKRFLSLDLSYGRPVNSVMFRHLMRHGMTEAEYDFFLQPRDRIRQACVMGNDYYEGNEHWVEGTEEDPYHYTQSGEIFGYYVITHQYYERYRLPVMHTETNKPDRAGGRDEAEDWLRKQWANVVRLKQDGVPVLGFTWYGLVDLVGWDHHLRHGNEDPVPAGLCDLERRIRPVGNLFKEIIDSWGPLLGEPEVLNESSGEGASRAAQAVRAVQSIR